MAPAWRDTLSAAPAISVTVADKSAEAVQPRCRSCEDTTQITGAMTTPFSHRPGNLGSGAGSVVRAGSLPSESAWSIMS
jgi:hypothetical protein